MGKNKKIRGQILGHEKIIAVHLEKIQEELKKPIPNLNLINHWNTEIKTFQENIQKLLRKLEK